MSRFVSVPSYAIEVDRLSSSLPIFEGFEDIGFQGTYTTTTASPTEAYDLVNPQIETIQNALGVGPGDTQEVAEELGELLKPTVKMFDEIAREYNDVQDTERTRLHIRYRRGLGRASGLIGFVATSPLQRKMGSLTNRFVFPGYPHVDVVNYYEGLKKYDRLVAASNSRAGIVYEGPVYSATSGSSLFNSVILPRFNRLLARGCTELEAEKIYAIPPHTLHKQAAQLSRKGSDDTFVAADFVVLPSKDRVQIQE